MLHTTPLQHDSNIIINGRRCYIGTVAGYAESYKEDAAGAVAVSSSRGHELWWVGRHATVICADAGYYAQQQAKFAGCLDVQAGDSIIVTDSVHGANAFRIERAPNDNYKLVKLT